MRSRMPILMTRRGRMAGIFFPPPEITLPIALKRELYDMLSNEIARQLKRGVLHSKVILAPSECSSSRTITPASDPLCPIVAP